ncbi:MAG: hypothetical protein ACRD42_05260 [Nitrososphaeraceae archaeon]
MCQTVELPRAFTISGQGDGRLSCPRLLTDASITISAQGEEDGTVTGSVNIVFLVGGGLMSTVSGGTTDGNTFSLSGETIPGCNTDTQPFTLSGDCGNDVIIRYEEPESSGTFTGDVECTLA